jgi:hypothetical protein
MLNGTVDGASESHAHVGPISFVEAAIEISVHIVILEIGEKSKGAKTEGHHGWDNSLKQP